MPSSRHRSAPWQARKDEIVSLSRGDQRRGVRWTVAEAEGKSAALQGIEADAYDAWKAGSPLKFSLHECSPRAA